jgi:hypothetical protein
MTSSPVRDSECGPVSCTVFLFEDEFVDPVQPAHVIRGVRDADLQAVSARPVPLGAAEVGAGLGGGDPSSAPAVGVPGLLIRSVVTIYR